MSILMSEKSAVAIEDKFGTDVFVEVCRALAKARRKEETIIPFREAMVSAKRIMKANKAIRSMHFVCRRGDDEVWYVVFGPRGGWKRITILWDKSGNVV